MTAVAAVVGIFGLIVGSFLNVCIYRMPRRESLVFPASHCPSCGTALHFYDNVPVVSYLLLGGKCRYCRKKIKIRYPIVELLNAVLYVAVFFRFGLNWAAGVYALFASALIVITFIDLDIQIIPDRITLTGIPIGLLVGSLLLPDPFLRTSPLGWQGSLIGAAAGFSSYYLIAYLSVLLLKKEGMGGGDIKMMAMVGAFLGWKAVILTTFLGSLAGSLAGIAVMILQGRKGSLQIPFGPFLAFGSLVSLFWGQELLVWYLS